MYTNILTQVRKSSILRKSTFASLGSRLRWSSSPGPQQRSFSGPLANIRKTLFDFWWQVISIGVTPELDDYEAVKLRTFNQLNFIGVLTGLVIPIIGLSQNHLPALAFVVALSPALVALLVLLCNFYGNYKMGHIYFFTFYPIFTSLPYGSSMDLGVELFFIFYGALSLFFFEKLRTIIFCFSFSAFFYLLITALGSDYKYKLEDVSPVFFFLNHLLAVFFIFYSLYLVKRENMGYQFRIREKNRQLHQTNLQIEKQKAEIAEKAVLLEEQAAQLSELNNVKNKLFSVIAHDLKGPMYAMRNLFQMMQQRNIPGEEIKALLPDVVNDLNYTTGLMENLLQWAKLQMQASTVAPQELDVTEMVDKTFQLLRRQAEVKGIQLFSNCSEPAMIEADKEMINLVLRNLISNAIKFTPEKGNITVGIIRRSSTVEVYIQDTGVGISREDIQAILEARFHSTAGTANEMGTGLGLMLCREFLAANRGELLIKSKPGKGSTFSFVLPAAE